MAVVIISYEYVETRSKAPLLHLISKTNSTEYEINVIEQTYTIYFRRDFMAHLELPNQGNELTTLISCTCKDNFFVICLIIRV